MKANDFEVFTKAIVLSFGKSGITLSIPEYELVDFKTSFDDYGQIKDVKIEEIANKKKVVLKISDGKGKKKNYEENPDDSESFFLKKIEFFVYFIFF